MSSEKTKTARDAIQDTFRELQAQLEKEQLAIASPARGGGESAEKNLEDQVASLARREGFEVGKMIGFGGMGAVVRAVDVKLKRTVALKFLPPEVLGDAGIAAELRQEAELASRIQHENVVQILSWHEVDNVPFFAMELVEGETVDQFVKRMGKLSMPDALRIAAEAARGLEALHNAGIVHRDIKPQNILLARDGRVKITDFGISRTQDMISAESARTTSIAGTPKFMSPEQARGEAATKHSDIYSLGATLYYMLAGRSPVEPASDVREQISNVREGLITPIRTLLPRLNRDVATLVMRCLSLKQAKRPWDAATFRTELDKAYLAYSLRPKASLGSLMHANRMVVFSALWLVLGVMIGLLAGGHLAEIGARDQSVGADALAPLARDYLFSLEAISLVGEAPPDLSGIRDELQKALEESSAQRLAQLLPAARRRFRRAELVAAAHYAAADPRSPVQATAREFLRVLPTLGQVEADRAVDAWYAAWLVESLKFVPTPTPPPGHPEEL